MPFNTLGVDVNNPYSILGLPDPQPNSAPLSRTDLDNAREARLNLLQGHIYPGDINGRPNPNDPLRGRERAQVRDAVDQIWQQQQAQQQNPVPPAPNPAPNPAPTPLPNQPSQTAPEKNTDWKKAQGEFAAKHKKAAERYYNDLQGQKQSLNTLMQQGGSGELRNLQALIIWLLLDKTVSSPLNTKIVYDENGNPVKGKSGNVKRELHWNPGVKLSDIIHKTNPEGSSLNPFNYGIRHDAVERLSKGLDKMGSYGPPSAKPLDDKAYELIEKQGSQAFNDFIRDYEKSGKVTVTRDSNNVPQGVEWHDKAAERVCLERLSKHVEQYTAREQQLRQQQNPNNTPPTPAPRPANP